MDNSIPTTVFLPIHHSTRVDDGGNGFVFTHGVIAKVFAGVNRTVYSFAPLDGVIHLQLEMYPLEGCCIVQVTTAEQAMAELDQLMAEIKG